MCPLVAPMRLPRGCPSAARGGGPVPKRKVSRHLDVVGQLPPPPPLFPSLPPSFKRAATRWRGPTWRPPPSCTGGGHAAPNQTPPPILHPTPHGTHNPTAMREASRLGTVALSSSLKENPHVCEFAHSSSLEKKLMRKKKGGGAATLSLSELPDWAGHHPPRGPPTKQHDVQNPSPPHSPTRGGPKRKWGLVCVALARP